MGEGWLRVWAGRGLLGVTFFAGLVLLLETLLFHLFNYVYDYFAATGVISLAVLGIALGAFAAAYTRVAERTLFAVCAIGTTVSLQLCFFQTAFVPKLWLTQLTAAPCFFFPVLYVAFLFREASAARVYLYDMLGAFLGVVAVVVLYAWLGTEDILLLCGAAIPAAGLLRALLARARWSIVACAVLTLGGIALVALQVATDRFNVYDILRALPLESKQGLDRWKSFRFQARFKRQATYDSLTGRIDLLTWNKGRVITVYNGYPNDTIFPSASPLYRDFKAKGNRWPSSDIRLPYGIVDEPRICIIGSAAEGIVKSVKRVTPLDRILAIEINPSIPKLMRGDYFEASGRAYEGLKVEVGNAISLLRATRKRFDVITLINAHSTKSLGFPGPPDYLHTLESYNLYFDHLTERGVLLLEERPLDERGELALQREIRTLWEALRRRGSKDPTAHFAIWEWMAGKSYHGKLRKRHWNHYLGLIISKKPLIGAHRSRTLRWLRWAAESKRYAKRVAFLKGYKEEPAMRALFRRAETGRFSDLEQRHDLDSGIVTNDRPFLQIAQRSHPRVTQLILWTALITGLLWIALGVALLRRSPKREALVHGTYNTLIGLGFFFVEIIFLQTFQNVFISPTSALIYVLGLLLLGAGIGGRVGKVIPLWAATLALAAMVLAALWLPETLLAGGSHTAATVAAALLVLLNGALMGVFFPRGLEWARGQGLEAKIPHLFAINSVAGSMAVVLALYFGIRFGYRVTLIVGVACYGLACLIALLGGVAKTISGEDA